MILVHQYCGESGAIGAAIEALRVAGRADARSSASTGWRRSPSRPPATNRPAAPSARTSACAPSSTPGPRPSTRPASSSPPAKRGRRRRRRHARDQGPRDAVKKANPNFVEVAGAEAFRSTRRRASPPPTSRTGSRERNGTGRRRNAGAAGDGSRIGMPRLSTCTPSRRSSRPTSRAWACALNHLIFSDFTDDTMWSEGSRRGSIDPCFPSKVALAHVHQLVPEQQPDIIFFPYDHHRPHRDLRIHAG